MTRPLRPRLTATAPVTALCISDLTAPAAVGLEPRTFRELVARERIPHARAGQRVIVSSTDWLAAIQRIAQRQASERGQEAPATVETPEEDAGLRLLRRLGRVRGGAR